MSSSLAPDKAVNSNTGLLKTSTTSQTESCFSVPQALNAAGASSLSPEELRRTLKATEDFAGVAQDAANSAVQMLKGEKPNVGILKIKQKMDFTVQEIRALSPPAQKVVKATMDSFVKLHKRPCR